MLGGMVIIYALVLYPLLGWLSGHIYPRNPTFGAPCPVTIFTLGLLLWARPPAWIIGIPVGWALVATSASWFFGVLEDLALIPAAAVVIGISSMSGWKKDDVTYKYVGEN